MQTVSALIPGDVHTSHRILPGAPRGARVQESTEATGTKGVVPYREGPNVIAGSSVVIRAVVVQTGREVVALRGREVQLDVVERTGAGRRSEAVALPGWTAAPARDAVRVAAKAREVVGQRDSLGRLVDLERERLVRPVEAVRALGGARWRMLGRFVIVAERVSRLLTRTVSASLPGYTILLVSTCAP